MQVMRPVGREAAARKYDLLSALTAHALASDGHRQRLVLRLIALITSRYNWQRDELCVGQREIARLWCVDERTVKRDMARLREMGWVTVKRQGARGRVSVLGLDLERMLLDSRGSWANVGEDFVARLSGQEAQVPTANVVPFRRQEEGGHVWARIRAQLSAEDPALFEAWIAPLEAVAPDGQGGCLELRAPTRFHATYVRTHLMARLRVALRRAEPSLSVLRIS